MWNLSTIFALVALVAATVPAAAQDWPTRPVTMVSIAAAGSANDISARILAPPLSELLGQRVIVENVGGAGGTTAALRVARAAPDGYQFVLGNVGTHAMNQTLPNTAIYNATTDFAPVTLIYEQPLVLIARKDLPATDLPQFIAYAKANQTRMQYGSAGTGNPTHLACALLNVAIGINVTHVPYRGGAPAMQDLFAGRIDYQCPATSIALPQIESKTVNAIAILTRVRSSALPTLLTAHEQGLADFDVGAWTGIFLPKGTPAAIVDRLNQATVTAMETPTVRERLKKTGVDLVAPERRSPEYLRQFVESEIKKWATAIKAAGITPQ